MESKIESHIESDFYDTESENNEEETSIHYNVSKNMTIDNGRYEIIRKIGSGRFSRVWEAVDINNNRKVALKIYKSSKDNYEYYENEIKIFELLNNESCDFIVKKYEHFNINTNYGVHGCISLELCGPHLFKLLDKSDDCKLPEPIVKSIIKQVINGLQYIHSKGIIHTDIKPENIFLVKPLDQISDFNDIKIKLGDLGSSTPIDDLYSLSIGTTPYIAPEIVMRSKYNTSADIWALGGLIFELMTGDCLFDPEAYFGDSDDDGESEDDESENGESENGESEDDESEDDDDESDDDNYEDWELIHLHISLFHKILGPLPKDLVSKGEYFEDFFTKDGKLRRIPNYLEKKCIKDILIDDHDFSENNAIRLATILNKIFVYMPENRMKCNDLLELDWLQGDFKKEYLKLLNKYQNENKNKNKNKNRK